MTILLFALVLFSTKANAQVMPFGMLHSNVAPPKVGDFRNGGVVFYVAPTPTDLNGDGSDNIGLIVAISDQSAGVNWGCRTIFLVVNDTAIGTGADNTREILKLCDDRPIAAQICDNYSVIVGNTTYNDWFLPSIYELNEIYKNIYDINTTAESNGGTSFQNTTNTFFSSLYWSSTELTGWRAFVLDFSNGDSKEHGKTTLTNTVRAIRAF